MAKTKVGDYITAISERNNDPIKTNLGYVRQLDTVNQMIEKGVTHVWIRSKSGSNTTPKKFDNALTRRVIQETKHVTERVFKNIANGKSSDLIQVKEAAKDIVTTTLENPETLYWASVLRKTDNYLLEHSFNVSCLLITFGHYLKFDKQTLESLAFGGIIHDIGKTQLDIKILNKVEKLTREEFDHIKNHQHYALDLVREMSDIDTISKQICLMHHEKIDGSGYPLGLAGDEISIYGRMAAIVDIYDALTSQRSYKEGLSPSSAYKIMTKLTPHHLDKKLVYQFINCIGIYPEMSFVELSDGTQGMVWKKNSQLPLQPIIKRLERHEIYRKFVTTVDLSNSELSIVGVMDKNEKNRGLRSILAANKFR